MPMPTVNSVGAEAFNTSGITVAAGATHDVDDIDIMLARCGPADTFSLTTPAGFANIATLTQSLTGAGGQKMGVWWRRWNGTDGDPVFADAGTFICGFQIHISGCKTTGDPWNVMAAGNTDDPGDTTVSVAGATTTEPDCLVIGMAVQGLPDSNSGVQFGTATNADLANITERRDQSRNLGAGGGFWMFTGEKASAGAYAATTCTAATSARRVCGSIALEGITIAPPFPHKKRKIFVVRSWPR